MNQDQPQPQPEIQNLYDQAMQVTDQTHADIILEQLFFAALQAGHTRGTALQLVKDNLGYYAGYFGAATRERVERLFHCAHPYFGPIAVFGQPTGQEAYDMGLKLGQQLQRDAEQGRQGDTETHDAD